MTTVIKLACNALTWPCGCRAWHQWESGAWIRKRWPCYRHWETG